MSSEDAQAANTEEMNEEETVEETETEDTGSAKEAETEKKSEKSDSTLPDDPEVLRREISKLRKENAAKRTQNREEKEAARKWKEHVDSQKTELEKLQDQLKTLQEENDKFKIEKLQKDLAKEHGVDPDLAEFITGSDLDEMTEKAKKLAKKSQKPKSTTANDLRAGRNSPPAEMNGSKWIRELFKG